MARLVNIYLDLHTHSNMVQFTQPIYVPIYIFFVGSTEILGKRARRVCSQVTTRITGSSDGTRPNWLLIYGRHSVCTNFILEERYKGENCCNSVSSFSLPSRFHFIEFCRTSYSCCRSQCLTPTPSTHIARSCDYKIRATHIELNWWGHTKV